ncbi:thioredoxin domain-containing protein [bacterium]|nr:MAG: thioredoxin domain-containing protein [bacterium]RIK62793.1 MAG: thioredoxin domain-containing protein [Planctomycetota bacterium]
MDMNAKRANRLAREQSPYLLQHAHNPVDWYPWGPEAFARARDEDKLVFLSIGYATCHWCHVMERESFENEATARLLNESFISVKVDREERPDIDNIYMSVVQAFTGGHGGWPMSLFLTPDQRPVFAATYLPPENRYGRAGFPTLLRELGKLWKQERERLLEQAQSVTQWLNAQGLPENPGTLEPGALKRFGETMRALYDSELGGFGRAPKFPRSHAVSLLLRLPGQDHLAMAEHTAQAMWQGGLHDHLGGGFHRYSTDREWLLPHFEKMLYDQALLLDFYRELFQLTGKPLYADACRDIMDYVLRDLRDEAGGFYSAEDADSEGEEGKFYVWTWQELVDALGEDDGAFFARTYGCREGGNFRDEATHQQSGANILHLPWHAGLPAPDAQARLAPLRRKLLALRSKRVRPLLDDKVLTDWNGLMIGAAARAGAALGEPGWIEAAQKAADFASTTLMRDGRLLHRCRKGQAGIPGFLEDYAFLAQGLLELYQADFEPARLELALRLCREMVRLFRDEKEKVFHTQGKDDPERLIAPSRSFYDGAIPSGNAAACLALVRVGRLTQDESLVSLARQTLEAFAGEINSRPESHPYALMAAQLLMEPMQEIVIAGPRHDEGTQALLATVQRRFLPRAVLALHDGEDIERVIPALKAQGPVGGKPAAYLCEHFACKAPVTDAASLAALL